MSTATTTDTEASNPLQRSDLPNDEDAEENAVLVSPSHKRLRRTLRNTQRIRFPSPTSLCYRRLDELFFSSSLPQSCHKKKNWEQVHSEPNIYRIENFLTTKEIDHFMTFVATKRFQKSFVDGEHSSAIHDRSHRTSTFLSFPKQHDKIIATIEQRAADLLGTQAPALEAIQLVRYEATQFFGIHHDLGLYDEQQDTVELPPKIPWSPRRLVTLFCYLNDCPHGGATYFPKASHLRIQPVAGSAILFANVLANGMPDLRTLHAGEPPIGPGAVKYGLNIWLCEEY